MLATRKWTIEEYHRAADLQLFRPDERLELIEGDILVMSPKGSAHVVCCQKLLRSLRFNLASDYDFQCQDPIQIGDSEPEPDLAIIRRNLARIPTAEDVVIVMEISDSTLKYDRETKGKIYAKAQIKEYWIFNLIENVLEIYREPESELEQYKAKIEYKYNAQVDREIFTNLLKLSEIFSK
jgi:Uma2 family endonuclease